MSIVLPTSKVKAERQNPKRMIIYSKPKTGKTTAYAGLENNLILDLENGSDYVEALKVKINNLQELLDAGKAIKAAGNPYKIVTIDTVTALEDMIQPLAVKLYRGTSMGKNYDGDNVTTLPNGAGY
jgi:replication-associated recombination protein RarA